MLADLPTACSTGIKRNAKGHNVSWIGYKLHIDTADGDIPISCLLTSASVHDSQAAIPLASITAGRVTNLYDLMDSAYDAPEIWDKSRALGHAPIIDAKPRRGCKAQAAAEELARRRAGYEPAEAIRYNERTAAERVNGALKDSYGGRTVRVRSHTKVFCHPDVWHPRIDHRAVDAAGCLERRSGSSPRPQPRQATGKLRPKWTQKAKKLQNR